MNSIDYIIARLKEPSTWAAVSLLVGYLGYELSADKMMQAAVAAILLIGIFWKKDTQSGTGDGSK